MIKKKSKLILLVIYLGITPSISSADSFNVYIKGEIFIPPCKINNDQPIDISFGKVATHKVDGVNYAQIKSVNLTCDYYSGTPYVMIYGDLAVGAHDNVLATKGASANNMGIALYQGNGTGVPMNIGFGEGGFGQYGYEITQGLSATGVATSTFTFTSVPFKYGSGELEAGYFNASASMVITYV
jgi:minor pilin subunit PapF